MHVLLIPSCGILRSQEMARSHFFHGPSSLMFPYSLSGGDVVANIREDSVSKPTSNTKIKWCRLERGCFEINTYAAINVNQSYIGACVIIMNHLGVVLGSFIQRILLLFSPQVAKAFTLLRGALFAVSVGLVQTILKSDAKLIVDIVNLGAIPTADIGVIIGPGDGVVVTEMCSTAAGDGAGGRGWWQCWGVGDTALLEYVIVAGVCTSNIGLSGLRTWKIKTTVLYGHIKYPSNSQLAALSLLFFFFVVLVETREKNLFKKLHMIVDMDAKPKLHRPRPKLDRRNAIKNIDYNASSSSASSSLHDDNSSSNLRTRSLDLSPLTSFRVKGIDGEFDLICSSLGLSPEDFAIPAAAWEAQKRRSSFDVTTTFESTRTELNRVSPDFEAKIRLGKVETEPSFSVSNNLGPIEGDSGKLELNYRSNLITVGPCAGINGDRPPALSPPPMMLRPVVDNFSSTWDILKSFAPEADVDFSNSAVREKSESDSSISNDDDDDDDDEYDGNRALGLNLELVYNVSPNGKFRRRITSWQKGELLGSGSFGTVYEGFTDDGFFFAVKEVSLLDQGTQGKQSILQLEQEISLLSRFEHDNIVRYHGTDKDEKKLYIFLELVTKGSLASLYQKYHLRDSQVSAYTRQILNGLKYLHDKNVVHRDIKCANILVDASGSVKLADFGLAKATKTNDDVKSCKGTAFWMAPEVVNLKNHGYGLAADIWSLGCTVLEMLTRQPPYSHLEGMQALFRIGKGEPPPVPSVLSREARDFILKCIQVNPNDRPTAARLLNHPFIKRPLQTSWSPAFPRYNIKLP
ncbi:hypothetical protein Dsin_032263 [Dipteronia sinensis]|uniref:mitogen-activated protein kinase kinase kinase n=1 Tax=Dipteronia sinensis TaxID=43782 RepID=A0AAD9ZN15_9ROSI|nr:hypothetical protein Dsin_032263 [Dipteronia sinensis]